MKNRIYATNPSRWEEVTMRFELGEAKIIGKFKIRRGKEMTQQEALELLVERFIKGITP